MQSSIKDEGTCGMVEAQQSFYFAPLGIDKVCCNTDWGWVAIDNPYILPPPPFHFPMLYPCDGIDKACCNTDWGGG